MHQKDFRNFKVSLTGPKLQIVCVLLYTGDSSLHLLALLKRTIFVSLPFFLSGIVYRYTCANWKVTYHGKTFPHFLNRSSEHIGTSNLTRKCIKNAKELAISNQLLQCDSAITFDDLDILGSDSNKFLLLTKESLLIKRGEPVLNRTTKSFLLDHFD